MSSKRAPSHRTRIPKVPADLFVYGRDTLEARRYFSARQRGKCAICRRKSSKLALDHEHSELSLCRGLLCSNCNTALGLLGDDRDALNHAIAYLDEHDDRNERYLATDDFAERTVKVYRFALTPEQRAARNDRIRRDFAESVAVGKLTEKYGLSKAAIYEIVYGDTA